MADPQRLEGLSDQIVDAGPISTNLDPAIVTQLDRLATRKRVSRARLLEDAIRAFVRDSQVPDAT